MWQDSTGKCKQKNHTLLVNCVLFCFWVWCILLLFNILDFVPSDLQLQRAYPGVVVRPTQSLFFVCKNVKVLGWGWMFLNTSRISAENVIKTFFNIIVIIGCTYVIYYFPFKQNNRKFRYILLISHCHGRQESNIIIIINTNELKQSFACCTDKH